VRLDEDLLEHVLGVLGRAQHVAAEREEARVVAIEEDLEGVLVAGADHRDEARVSLKFEQGRPPAKNAGARAGV
jgi:hypothetical protein